jgi:hypothetical protein
VVHVHPGAALERAIVARSAEKGHATVEPVGHRERSRLGDDVTARDLVFVEPSDVERHPLTGLGTINGLAVHLHAPDPPPLAARVELDCVVAYGGPRPHRARHDGPGAGDREDPVHRQAHGQIRLARGRILGNRIERREEFGQAGAGARGHRHDRRVGYRSPTEKRADILGHQVDPVRVREIRLRDRDNAARDSEQVDDREVLARLRHDAVVGRHHEQHGVDTGCAGYHVPHKLLVSRDVDDTHRAPTRQAQAREAELDRDAALLLLGKSIGIGAGERFDECRLPVVDVTRGAEDERWRGGHETASSPKKRATTVPTTRSAMARASPARSAVGSVQSSG